MTLHPPRRTPEEEMRLMILYTIAHLPPCTATQLQQILFDYNEMNYFDMMFALNDLCANGQLIREKFEGDTVYRVTDAGKEVLALFAARVPQSMKNYMAHRGLDFQAHLKEEEQYPRQIRKTEQGDYVVSLGIEENGRPVMQLTVSVPSPLMAQDMVNSWAKKAGEFYKNTMFTLAEDDQ